MSMTPQPVVRRRPGRVWRKREVSFMDFDFNKIKEMGLEYAEKGKNAAKDLAEKGRTGYYSQWSGRASCRRLCGRSTDTCTAE